MARRFLPATPEKLTDALEEIEEREHYVASEAVSSYSVNILMDTLTINFTDGSSYAYSGVPNEVIAEFSRAGSKGQYFNANIRDVYSHSRVG